MLVERLGKERRYETMRNGQRYQVVERQYALFPQRSGGLRIPSVVFHGRVSVPRPPQQNRRSRDPFFDRFFEDDPFSDPFFADSPFGGRSQSVVARSPGKTLKVLPPPEDYRGRHWLPARDLKLYDSWSDALPVLRAGEPVTRILAIRAKGLEGSQLPQPEMPETADYKVYPEQPATSNRVEEGWVVGEIQRAFTIVPQYAGKLKLPEIRMRWWDVQANREREAVLPGRELRVAPGSGNRQAAPPPVTASGGAPGNQVPAAPRPVQPAAADGGWNGWQGLWPWALALLLLPILALAGWRRLRARASEGRKGAQGAVAAAARRGRARPEREALAAARRELRDACAANDARAVATVLLKLARLQWPDDPPLDLPTLGRRQPAHAAQLAALDRALYSGRDETDSWKPLCETLRDGFGVDGEKGRGQQEEALAPLYPE